MDSYTRKELTLQAAAAAEDIRVQCGIAYNAPINPINLASKRKCEVRFMSLPSLEGIYSPTPGPTIVLGSQRPAGRRAFTCAHELGHHEFSHGMRLDELNHTKCQRRTDPDEFLADMFAASLLMPSVGVRKAIKQKGFQIPSLTPLQIFWLSSYFGVGYGTIIDHCTWTLKIISNSQRESLLKTQPKKIKEYFGGSPQSEVVLVDDWWCDRAVDLEVADIIVLPTNATIKEGHHLSQENTVDGFQVFKAKSRGYDQAFMKDKNWAVNIRITQKHFEGLAKFRFLCDPEEGQS